MPLRRSVVSFTAETLAGAIDPVIAQFDKLHAPTQEGGWRLNSRRLKRRRRNFPLVSYVIWVSRGGADFGSIPRSTPARFQTICFRNVDAYHAACAV